MKKKYFLFLIIISQSIFSQSYIQVYQDRVNLVSQTNIENYLQEFANFGVKSSGSINNTNALNWLKTKYSSFGYSNSDIVEIPFSFGSVSTKNLVVTKTGTLYPNTFVIVCGHYDTIAGPGVNDNGSGVSTILEIARILKNIPTEYSIKFINFSGEEQGLHGSQNYVNSVVNSTNPKMDIRLVFNIDQAGGIAGQVNNTIVCESDQSFPTTNNAESLLKTQELSNCTTLYSTLQTVFGPAYSSDYIPFQNNGEIITGFYEHNVSTYPHTSNDTYANMDPSFVYQVAKAATGATQHFAKASTVVLQTMELENTNQNFEIYPNPAQKTINVVLPNKSKASVEVKILDLSGKLVKVYNTIDKLDISDLSNGNYLIQVTQEGRVRTKNLIIAK